MAHESLYPLFPVCSILAAVLVLLVLVASTFSVRRQSWNFSLTVLFFLVFSSAVAQAINAIFWANNMDIPTGALAVYCDIWTHVQVFSSIAVPACTLVTTRRLYLATASHTADVWSTVCARRLNFAYEFIFVFVLPAIGSGIFYTLAQFKRFAIFEQVGCVSTVAAEGFTIVALKSWSVLFPLICLFAYCPHIFLRIYRHSKSFSGVFDSHGGDSRQSYIRIAIFIVLESLTILTIGIISIINVATFLNAATTANHEPAVPFPFFVPPFPREAVQKTIVRVPVEDRIGLVGLAVFTAQWGVVFQGCAIFIIFGRTDDAYAAYSYFFRSLSGRRRTQDSEKGKYTIPALAVHDDREGSSLDLTTVDKQVPKPGLGAASHPLAETSTSALETAPLPSPVSTSTRWSQASLPKIFQLEGMPIPRKLSIG